MVDSKINGGIVSDYCTQHQHAPKNIFDEGELDPKSTIYDFLIVRLEGKRKVNRNIDFYNLDAIISVGYRIKSHVTTKFRIRATQPY